MPRVSAVPYSKMDAGLKAIVHASDEALNGSEWVQYFCHPAELYKSFVKFYYEHVATEEYGISWKLSEMMRHMVAVHNYVHPLKRRRVSLGEGTRLDGRDG